MKEIYILGNIPPSSVVGYRVEKAVRGRVVPRNGFTGEVRLSSSAGTLEGDRILLGPGPSSVKLRLPPSGSTSVSIRATDNRGRGLREGTLEVRVNDPAPAPRVTTWTVRENSEVPFDPGSLAQPSLPEQIRTFCRSEVRAEVRSYYQGVTGSGYTMFGGPLVKIGIYGETEEKPLLGYGALVEVLYNSWSVNGPYYLPDQYALFSARSTPITEEEIVKYGLFLKEPGFRPWGAGTPEETMVEYDASQEIDKIYSAVEDVIGRDLRAALDALEQGQGSVQDVRRILVTREKDLREAVQKAGGKALLGYRWSVRSQLFLCDPSGSTVTSWTASYGST